jgi:hypothetical protein
MCVVIDMNVLCCVFQASNPQHQDFSPVKIWVTQGNGFIVFGGTHYKEELRKAKSYFGLFLELSKQGKVKQVNHELVDEHERQVEAILGHPDCDDAHLIAIIRVSGCRLICSNDRRADKHLKNRKCYLPGAPSLDIPKPTA